MGNSASGAQGAFVPTIDNGNGTYTATFTGVIAGSNTIEAAIAGVKGSKTASIKVTPGPYVLATSVVTVSATTVEVGKKVTLTLQPEDAYGNKVTEKNLDVAFEFG